MASALTRIIDCLSVWKCHTRLKSDCCKGGCVCDVVEGDTRLSREISTSNTPHVVSKKTSFI